MGIAAYNRGSRTISTQIDREQLEFSDRLLADLNTAVSGTTNLFQNTVARFDESRGGWWLMNRPEEGWASHGYFYLRLWDIAKEYHIRFGAIGQDGVSKTVEILCA